MRLDPEKAATLALENATGRYKFSGESGTLEVRLLTAEKWRIIEEDLTSGVGPSLENWPRYLAVVKSQPGSFEAPSVRFGESGRLRGDSLFMLFDSAGRIDVSVVASSEHMGSSLKVWTPIYQADIRNGELVEEDVSG